MAVVCVILIGTTVAGIVGLTSFWVGQRTHQIGVRRALGARKVDILRYFQVENLLIAGGGTLIGAVLALVLNLWLVTHFEMSRMPMNYLIAGMVAVLVLGQAAVLSPARWGPELREVWEAERSAGILVAPRTAMIRLLP